MTIRSARIEYNEQGTPVASEFNDVYFSNQNGLAESQYVFIAQNKLPERWQQWQHKRFVIAETGFGTGLNLLAVWQAFTQFKCQYPNSPLKTLHFISTEKFPLDKADLKKALLHWPQLSQYSKPLIEQYPHLLPGCHRLSLGDGTLILDLWFGDIEQSLPAMVCPIEGVVDAWFLDGFAPSKNPQMWSPILFSHMARLSKHNATFATFTAAGMVKRGLQQQGFTVKKVKGFGRKREMLAGQYLQQKTSDTQPRLHRRIPATLTTHSKIAIIGVGIAGAITAHKLIQAGYEVHLFGQQQNLADGASGNPQGGFYPQLNGQFNIASQVQACAFEYAKQYYSALLNQGYHFDHDWCGVLQLGFNTSSDQRQQNLIAKQIWPQSLLHPVNSAQASDIAGVDLPYRGLFFPDGGWISPPQLVEAICSAAAEHGKLVTHLSQTIEQIHFVKGAWQLQAGKNIFNADCVVVAAGSAIPLLPNCKHLPIQAVRGQVEAVPEQSCLNNLKTVLCHKGYLTPSNKGRHALGSTYVKQDRQTDYRLAEQQVNSQTHQVALAETHWAEQVRFDGSGRAATRGSTPDHLPLVGNLYDHQVQKAQFVDLYKAFPESRYPVADYHPNLFVIGGLGSRGLTSAPLMAELLVSQMLGQPLPFASDLLQHLNPNRFLIKSLIRRELD